ncbi:MAG: CapA family protein [Anaerolineales bacterium]|nr:CapA family protein [Anaerolineales bacterium]
MKHKLLAAALGLLLTACSTAAGFPLPTTMPLIDPFPPGGDPRETAEENISIDEADSEAISFWIAPEVPDVLRVIAEMLSTLEDVVIVERAEDAQVRLEAGGENPISVWIYAVVVPFPRTRDAISADDLRNLWTTAGGNNRLYASANTIAAFESLWGSAAGTNVVQTSAAVDPEVLWYSSPVIALVPFEELNIRWKVLQVDGRSPLQRDFDPSRYPLVVVFGLTGPQESVDAIESMLAWPAINREPQKLTVLAMTGTTALARTTAARMEQYGTAYPARDILPWFQGADIVHVSNEVSFAEDCPTPNPLQVDLRFCSAPENQELLVLIGADIIELTGNHNLDWGSEAYLYTLDIYAKLGIPTYGGGSNLEEALQGVVLSHHGNRFLFLGCNRAGPPTAWAGEDTPGAATCDFDTLTPQITAAREAGYIPVFTFQWYENETVSYALREAALRMVDAGALIVSGSQAHQALGFEFYADAFIHYGLGNLFFDQMQAEEFRQEFIDRYIIYDGRLISVELLTAMLEDYARPRPMISWEREVFLQEIFEVSAW